MQVMIDDEQWFSVHPPTINYQDKEPMELFYGEGKIGIDCGCAYDDGRLACLRLDDGAVFYSD